MLLKLLLIALLIVMNFNEQLTYKHKGTTVIIYGGHKKGKYLKDPPYYYGNKFEINLYIVNLILFY